MSEPDLSNTKLAYTPDEAAVALGLSRSTIFKEIREGRLQARKPTPAKTLIPTTEMLAWLNSRPSSTAAA